MSVARNVTPSPPDIPSTPLQLYQQGLKLEPDNLQLLTSVAQFHTVRQEQDLALKAWQVRGWGVQWRRLDLQMLGWGLQWRGEMGAHPAWMPGWCPGVCVCVGRPGLRGS